MCGQDSSVGMPFPIRSTAFLSPVNAVTRSKRRNDVSIANYYFPRVVCGADFARRIEVSTEDQFCYLSGIPGYCNARGFCLFSSHDDVQC